MPRARPTESSGHTARAVLEMRCIVRRSRLRRPSMSAFATPGCRRSSGGSHAAVDTSGTRQEASGRVERVDLPGGTFEGRLGVPRRAGRAILLVGAGFSVKLGP